MQVKTEGARGETRTKTWHRIPFMGKFNLTDERLLLGLQRGDIQQGVDRQGREIFALTSMVHSDFKEKSRRDSSTRSKSLKDKEIDNQAQDFRDFNLCQFQIHKPGKSRPALLALPDKSSPSLLALPDRGDDCELTAEEWEQAQAVLNSSKLEVQKFLLQLKQMLREIGTSDVKDHLYVKVNLEFVYTVHVYMLQMQSHM